MEAASSRPVVFISYSWASESFKDRVRKIADQLIASGVDIRLDQYDLRPGNDANAFMEKMVHDSEVTKVLILCDPSYVAKANGRVGGVGTEAQIISTKVYESVEQDKFVVAVLEKPDNGSSPVPIYYGSRIWFDLSDSEKYGEKFDELLRWIHNKPRHTKPIIGVAPNFEESLSSWAAMLQSAAERAENSFRMGQADANGQFALLIQAMKKFILEMPNAGDTDLEVDERVWQLIAEAQPLSRALVTATMIVAEQDDGRRGLGEIARIIELLANRRCPSTSMTTWVEAWFDHSIYLTYEAFLFVGAALLEKGRFDLVGDLLRRLYYMEDEARGRAGAQEFHALWGYPRSFDFRQRRLNLRRLSVVADLLEARSGLSGIKFDRVMEFDLICWLRWQVIGRGHWYPHALAFSTRRHAAFETFARAKSRTFYDEVANALQLGTLEDFKGEITRILNAPSGVPRFDYMHLPLAALVGFDDLGELP